MLQLAQKVASGALFYKNNISYRLYKKSVSRALREKFVILTFFNAKYFFIWKKMCIFAPSK